jgi:hypothetical protein
MHWNCEASIMEESTVTAPVIKAISVLAAAGISNWSDAASIAALVYTLLLISEWIWKKFLRDWMKLRGRSDEAT